jgi:CelD/BcsL family acetyltransferase involved in cellulose biosynthesis
VRRNRALMLVLPLVVRRTAVGSVAGWMGEPLIQYGDAIVCPGTDPAPCLDAALEALEAHGDLSVLLLRRVREDAAAAEWLARRLKRTGPGERAVAVDLTEFSDPDDFTRARKSRAKRMRRRRRTLARIGEVGFQVLRGCDEAVSRVGSAIRMKRAWLEHRGLFGRAFADPRLQGFLEALVRDAEGSGAIVASLEVADRPAAIEVAFQHRNRHCSFLGAYDLDLAAHSPGQLQIQHAIEWSLANGIDAYDLMAPADDYKRELGTEIVEIRDYARLMSVTGLPAALWSGYGQRVVKSAYARLPHGLRTSIRNRFA